MSDYEYKEQALEYFKSTERIKLGWRVVGANQLEPHALITIYEYETRLVQPHLTSVAKRVTGIYNFYFSKWIDWSDVVLNSHMGDDDYGTGDVMGVVVEELKDQAERWIIITNPATDKEKVDDNS